MYLLKISLVIFSFMIGLNQAQAGLWQDENKWSDEYERKYQTWLNKANANMFAVEKQADGSANPYYGIKVDCADLVYTLRILFAFENKLPYAITNPVSKNGPLITNQINRFDNKEEGIIRIKNFLTWIHDLVSTNGLPKDTYSIPFNKVAAGTIILTTKKNHHSWTIKDIDKAGNPYLIFNSTVGRESGLKVQERHSWPNPMWIFEPEVDKLDESLQIPVYKPGSYAGFRFWRPIEYLKELEASVPGYSEQQHTVGLNKWKSSAISFLAKINETPDQTVSRILKDACADYKQRVDAVSEAETYKSILASDLASGKTAEESVYVNEYFSDQNRPSDSRCMIAKQFDLHSTPSRDKRLIDAIILARAYYTHYLKKFGSTVFSEANLSIYKAMFPHSSESAGQEAALDNGTTSSEYCTSAIKGVSSLSLTKFKRRLFQGKFSSNPNDSATGRFGFAKTTKDIADICPLYDFVQKKYDLDAIERDALNEVLSSEAPQ